MKETVIHPFDPIYDRDSRILILGTIPSPKSREQKFYYGHPQNRFWRIMTDIFGEKPLLTVSEKCDFLHKHHIALWDVFASCEIRGADDSSIRNAVPNDLDLIFDGCKIRAVFTNGGKASAAYRKFFPEHHSIPWYPLPSTSPANCRNWTYETLCEAWRIIRATSLA
ncbi:MAG: DNA-deoxyinosine glycosylase [Flexilinea sp.]|nr:DNA-deoxyinosine glycosylase [Flexilinea sp.]